MWCGMAGQGMIWHSIARHAMMWIAMAVGKDWRGLVCYDMARRDTAGQGIPCHRMGLACVGVEQIDVAWYGRARHDIAQHGMTCHDVAWDCMEEGVVAVGVELHGRAWHNIAQQDTAGNGILWHTMVGDGVV